MWKHYALGIGVSLLAGYFFIKAVDLEQMARAFGQMNPLWLVPAVGLYLLAYLMRALRWGILLRPVARLKLGGLWRAMWIGFLGNNLLPARLGEVVRAVVLGRSEGLSASSALATVVLERIYDGLTILGMLLVVLLWMPLPEGRAEFMSRENLRLAGWAALLFFAGAMGVMYLLRWQRGRVRGLLEGLCRPLPEAWGRKVVEIAGKFADGIGVLNPGELALVGLTSIGLWAALVMWAWVVMEAFGIDVGVMGAVLMEVVLALALIIPSAPAFIGTFHLGAAATLKYLGVAPGLAGSCAMVLWVVHFGCTSLMGLWYLWRSGLEWGVVLGRGGGAVAREQGAVAERGAERQRRWNETVSESVAGEGKG